MRKPVLFVVGTFVILALLISGCASAPSTEAAPTADQQTEVQPTDIPATDPPVPTETTVPTPTPLPGSLVLPLESFANEIPWLPMDESGSPGTYYYAFNLTKPPYNSVLVRQAFIAATDREALTDIVLKYYEGPRPATSFTPPEILGRDLYNEVGIPYDPVMARDLLEQAGYTDTSKFPTLTLLTNVSGGSTPYLHINVAEALAVMWQENLGIPVVVEYMDWEAYLNLVDTDTPEIYRMGWAADYNDPDNFLREVFVSGSEINRGGFSNAEYDQLVYTAAELTDPAERQVLYIQAEKILCEDEAVLIPIYHTTY